MRVSARSDRSATTVDIARAVGVSDRHVRVSYNNKGAGHDPRARVRTLRRAP
jgi:hypothetical protein